MAGEAQTQSFMLATATVMVGPQADLWKLDPSTHSLGLAKNFTIDATPTFTDLTQGVKNDLVYSVMTDNKVTAKAEIYEFTSKNLAYGAGLDGSSLETISDAYVTSTTVTGDGSVETFVISTMSDISSHFVVGNPFMVQQLGGTDRVYIGKVASATYDGTGHTLTVVGSHPVPTGIVYTAGSLISSINRINVGDKTTQPFMSAKVVGILPDNNEPCIVLLPKIRITKGLTIAFQTTAFGNLPFEFTPYSLVPTDPNYSDFAGTGPASIFDRM